MITILLILSYHSFYSIPVRYGHRLLRNPVTYVMFFLMADVFLLHECNFSNDMPPRQLRHRKSVQKGPKRKIYTYKTWILSVCVFAFSEVPGSQHFGSRSNLGQLKTRRSPIFEIFIFTDSRGLFVFFQMGFFVFF